MQFNQRMARMARLSPIFTEGLGQGASGVARNVPQSLTATIATGRITLSWTAPPVGSPSSYNLYRNGSLLASGLSNSPYIDLSVVPTVAYSYAVTAVISGVETAPSTPVLAHTTAGANGGTLVNAPVYVADVPTAYATYAYSLQTNAANKNVTVGTIISFSGDLTFSVFVKATDPFPYIVLAGNTGVTAHILDVDTPTTLVYRTSSNVARTFAIPTFTTGAWHCVQFVRTSGVLHAYLDGTESVTGGIADAGTSLLNEFFSYRNGGSVTTVSLSDLRLYNAALGSTELTAVANGSAGGQITTPQYWYKFNDNSTTALDSGSA